MQSRCSQGPGAVRKAAPASWALPALLLCACSGSVVTVGDEGQRGLAGANGDGGALSGGRAGTGAAGAGGGGGGTTGGADGGSSNTPTGGAAGTGGIQTGTDGGGSGGAVGGGGSGGGGGAVGGGGSGGGGGESARCDRSKPFGAPTPILPNVVGELNDTIRLTPDELTAYIKWYTPDFKKGGLRTVSRASVGEPWGAPTSFDSLAPGVSLGVAAPTGDRLNLFADAYVNDKWRIAWSSRASTDVPYSVLVPLATIPTGVDPTVTADGSQLVYSDGSDLFVTNRAGSDYSAPVALTALNSAYEDRYPAISPNGKVIYFYSTRLQAGKPGAGDTWRAERESVTAVWGAPLLVPDLSSISYDAPAAVTDDDCRFYGRQGENLFVAVRPK